VLCPPEDVGGVPSFYAFLDALQDPKHPNYEEVLDWYGGPFAPKHLDEVAIKKRLASIGPRKKRSAT